jgi:hypothetical protein
MNRVTHVLKQAGTGCFRKLKKGALVDMKLHLTLSSILRFAVVLLPLVLLAPALRAEARVQSQAASGEEFFIISSVDTAKKQIVLKRPTEVTELIAVDEKTVYRDEQDKAIDFKNLRAGDTVFVTTSRGTEGVRIASRIRRGPMTLEELHRRYLPFQ